MRDQIEIWSHCGWKEHAELLILYLKLFQSFLQCCIKRTIETTAFKEYNCNEDVCRSVLFTGNTDIVNPMMFCWRTFLKTSLTLYTCVFFPKFSSHSHFTRKATKINKVYNKNAAKSLALFTPVEAVPPRRGSGSESRPTPAQRPSTLTSPNVRRPEREEEEQEESGKAICEEHKIPQRRAGRYQVRVKNTSSLNFRFWRLVIKTVICL